jgi:peptidyl-prolyl cis-trans isomerase A (cyclophilin A)
MRLVFLPAAILLMTLVGCSGPASTEKAQMPGSAAKKTAPGPAPEVYRIKLATSKGDIVIEGRREWASIGAERFYELCRDGFFDEARFFRVKRKFIAQFGIHRDPEVTKLWNMKAPLPDDKRVLSNVRGTLAFAKSGPASRRTQVFINLTDNAKILDGEGFAPFAKIVDGLPVIDELYAKYGELENLGGAGPDSTKIDLQGNAYLIRFFGSMDYIKTATILPGQ